MKFSEAWLREWVDPDIDRQTLLDQLTMAGLEVEIVEAVAPPCRTWWWPASKPATPIRAAAT